MSIRNLTDTRKRKKEDLFVEGYFIESADDLSIGADTDTESIYVFGDDDALTGVTVNNGTFSASLLEEDAAGNDFLDLIVSNDPEAANPKLHEWKDVIGVTAWINKKRADNDRYLGGTFIGDLVVSPTGIAGAPNDRARRTFAGNSNNIIEIQGDWISWHGDLVASGGSLQHNTGTGLLAIPGYTNIYAVGIRAINSGASSWTTEYIKLSDITSAMLGSDGTIGWSTIATFATSLTAVNYAYVHYAYSGTGIYSTLSPDKLTMT